MGFPAFSPARKLWGFSPKSTAYLWLASFFLGHASSARFFHQSCNDSLAVYGAHTIFMNMQGCTWNLVLLSIPLQLVLIYEHGIYIKSRKKKYIIIMSCFKTELHTNKKKMKIIHLKVHFLLGHVCYVL